MDKLIGRQLEINELKSIKDSNKAEFVAIYGRRRVGKTFLINQTFGKQFCFSTIGIIDGTRDEQMFAFRDAMNLYNYEIETLPKNWLEAFQILRHFLQERMVENQKNIIFIDELPCFDTDRSDFVKALGYFWNSWASLQDNLALIVCGSSTSWMIKNIIDNHGGLHNRITKEIHLKEFTLKETKEYLDANNFLWGDILVLQTYMVFGGIPYYLSLLKNDKSLAQNIDHLIFRKNGELRREYARLYSTLFKNPEPYLRVVELLANTKSGIPRKEIAERLKMQANGKLTEILANLESCDIIRFFKTKQKKVSQQNGLYQLMDFYTLFYLTFAKNDPSNENYWTQQQGKPATNTWLGLAFEKVCIAHISQIKSALHIDTIQTEHYSWRINKAEDSESAQIDMVIERADSMINICEMKYSEGLYKLSKSEYDKFNDRAQKFTSHTNWKGGIIPTLITVNGIQPNEYSQRFAARVELGDLL